MPAALAAFVEGPPPASTGGFAETTCHSCHFDAPPNEPSGRLELEGVPAEYEPGARYLLTVELTRPGAVQGGFQLAVRHVEASGSGHQAGRLGAADARVQVVAGGPGGTVQYAEQTRQGAHKDPAGRLRWRINWESPRSGGPVVLHLAGNAANGDDSPLGDFAYFLEMKTVPTTAKAQPKPVRDESGRSRP